MPSRLQPAFFGGLFIGVLSSLPFVGNLNACCCLWVLAGGVLTAYLLQERTVPPLTAGDGALAGLLAGVIGALIAGVLTVAFQVMTGTAGPGAFDQLPEGIPPEFERTFEQLRSLPPVVWYVLPLAIFIVVFPIFGMLGGLLGVAIFKKKLPPPPAPGTMEVMPPQ
jgi:hypothetical protein